MLSTEGCGFWTEGLRPRQSAHAVATSAFTNQSAVGSAERTIDTVSMLPMSSASETSDSFAAASSSRAMAQEMVNVKSPPSEESASPAVGEFPMRELMCGLSAAMVTNATKAQLQNAGGEGCAIGPRVEGAGILRMRRLILESATKTAPQHTGAIRRQRGKDTRMHEYGRRSRLASTGGAIFGATLKVVFCTARIGTGKREVINALMKVHRFFEPVTAASSSMRGADVPYLINGLLSNRVCRSQRLCLVECKESSPKPFLVRGGWSAVAVSGTAAILLVHHLLLDADSSNAVKISTSLDACLEDFRRCLDVWKVGSAYSGEDHHEASLSAELRALERAQSSGVGMPRNSNLIPPHQLLQLRIRAMRDAAWPHGEGCFRCDEAAQTHACVTLSSVDPIRNPLLQRVRAAEQEQPPQEPLLVMPLSALPSDLWLASYDSDASTSVSASSHGSSGTTSSVGDDMDTAEVSDSVVPRVWTG